MRHLCTTGGYPVTFDISLGAYGMDRLFSLLKEGVYLDRVATSRVKVGRQR